MGTLTTTVVSMRDITFIGGFLYVSISEDLGATQ